MLNIRTAVVFDESIEHYEIHAHQPYATSLFNNTDEIRIVVQHQDLCLLPSKSSLHVYGRLVKADGTAVASTNLASNAVGHLFEEARYELNAVEIDKSKNVGLTSLMKGYVSLNHGQSAMLENAGWIFGDSKLTDPSGYFDVSIPLSLILGFAEDYRKIVVNAKHELILTRAKTDNNAVVQTGTAEDFSIIINKVEWLMPYVTVSNKEKITLLRFLEKDPVISMSFRAWELYEYPLLPQAQTHVWTVKTSTQLEKPRYVILGFQTGRKNNKSLYVNHFDHCNISNVKLFLNSQSYPYGNLNLDIERNQFAILYDMYTNFQANYYGQEAGNKPSLLKRAEFLQRAPLIVIDCARQNESLKNAPVDIRLEFESKHAFPAQTSAYCLILHDRIVEYNPVNGNVKKLA